MEWSFYDPQRGKKPGHRLQQEPGGHIMSARHWQTHRMITTMWSIVFAAFPVAWLKHPDKNHLREKGLISAHSQKLCKKTKLTWKKTQIWNCKRKTVSEFKNSEGELHRLDEVEERISQLEDGSEKSDQSEGQRGKSWKRTSGEQEA